MGLPVFAELIDELRGATAVERTPSASSASVRVAVGAHQRTTEVTFTTRSGPGHCVPPFTHISIAFDINLWTTGGHINPRRPAGERGPLEQKSSKGSTCLYRNLGSA